MIHKLSNLYDQVMNMLQSNDMVKNRHLVKILRVSTVYLTK